MSEAEDRPYLVEFAELLAAVRQQARMKVRQLGDAIGYTHPHVSRATSGKTLPSWPLTAAYLKGCGLADDEVEVWLRLWAVAKSKEREFRRTRQTATDGPEWRAAVAEVRRIDPLFIAIRRVTGREGLTTVLTRLGKRAGRPAELNGKIPTEIELDELVVKLGATRLERREFAQSLKRLAALPQCDGVHFPSGRRCILQRHRGKHLAAAAPNEHSRLLWLDDQ